MRNPDALEVWVRGVASDHHGDGELGTRKDCVSAVLSLQMRITRSFTTVRSQVSHPPPSPLRVSPCSEVVGGPRRLTLKRERNAHVFRVLWGNTGSREVLPFYCDEIPLFETRTP